MLTLTTERGNRYNVTDAGDIFRLDIPGFTASGKWKLRGVHRVGPFGSLGPLQSLRDVIASGESLTFKNGKGRYVVADLDHGTNRVWGGERLTAARLTA